MLGIKRITKKERHHIGPQIYGMKEIYRFSCDIVQIRKINVTIQWQLICLPDLMKFYLFV